jgi:benzoyl-CoA reductase/2-hydroxyglutaryl-CoA dehydratase subunit BcrC/BadD/HgdB
MDKDKYISNIQQMAAYLRARMAEGMSPAYAEATFNGWLCIAGLENTHFIYGDVDPVEWCDVKYGHQN